MRRRRQARPRRTSKNSGDYALDVGLRSGLEDVNAAHLRAHGVPVDYESYVISYEPLLKVRKYKLDFALPNGIAIETKGRFVTADRQKHKAIKEQHPDVDLRFVFSNSRQTISKASKTTYGMWCEKYGFQYADKLIPPAWIAEPTNRKSLAALEAARVKGKKQ